MEKKVRGIDVILRAAERKKNKKEVPVKFAENWHGELYRIGFGTIQRHCQRYGVVFSIEDARDAVAETVADFFEEGKLDSSIQQNNLNLSQEDKRQFSWETINAYRRYIHHGKTKADALDIILGTAKFYQWRPDGPEAALNWIELKESLKQTLTRADYIACQLLLQGYTKGETARLLKLNRVTLQRRFNRLPAGKLLRILK